MAAVLALLAVTAFARNEPVPVPSIGPEGAGFRGVIGRFDASRRPDLEVRAVGPTEADQAEAVWPWASVTKQVLAVMVLQQVVEGVLALDVPTSAYLAELAEGPLAPTLRELLQHRSGLRNPDDSPPDAAGNPTFYTDGASVDWCIKGRSAAGGDWRYNNCDFIVIGAILEEVTGMSLDALLQARIAGPAGLTTVRFADGQPPAGLARVVAREDLGRLRGYGASGGLLGSVADLLRFDAALLDGRLLPEAARVELWAGDPALGHMALGQWSFEAPVAGCNGAVGLVERRGAIGRFQVRNLIVPDRGAAVVAVTDDGAFDFGEIWTGRGFTHDLLSAELCR